MRTAFLALQGPILAGVLVLPFGGSEGDIRKKGDLDDAEVTWQGAGNAEAKSSGATGAAFSAT